MPPSYSSIPGLNRVEAAMSSHQFSCNESPQALYTVNNWWTWTLNIILRVTGLWTYYSELQDFQHTTLSYLQTDRRHYIKSGHITIIYPITDNNQSSTDNIPLMIERGISSIISIRSSTNIIYDSLNKDGQIHHNNVTIISKPTIQQPMIFYC